MLATDGLPTLQAKGQVCEAVSQIADIQAVIDLAGSGRTTLPSISTFVIGVLSPDDVTAGAPDILNAIAMSGGTSTAFIVDTSGNVQAGFRDALNQIRKAGLSCDLLVPQPEAGKTLDFGQVNVSFDDGTGAKTLDNVADATGCAKDPMSWFYDVDPAQGTPTKISTCPATCTAFQKTDMGSVQIELGCKTRQVVVKIARELRAKRAGPLKNGVTDVSSWPSYPDYEHGRRFSGRGSLCGFALLGSFYLLSSCGDSSSGSQGQAGSGEGGAAGEPSAGKSGKVALQSATTALGCRFGGSQAGTTTQAGTANEGGVAPVPTGGNARRFPMWGGERPGRSRNERPLRWCRPWRQWRWRRQRRC